MTARGGLWDVFDATHVLLPRRATVRVTAQPGLPPAGVRLLREACIVEALAHPGVPRLYDSGRLGDRRPWIAGERIDGRSLAEAMTGGALPAVRVAALLRDVAAVLDHAHRRGIVHRSVRPETILLTDGERGWPVCLTDWSEARAHDAIPAPRFTGPHDAPEVARGDVYDGKVDVYALGVVAFEALSGIQLFHGAAPLSMVADRVLRYLNHRGVVSAATGQLAWLVDDMLGFDPLERPSAAEVRVSAAAIAAVIDRELAQAADQALAILADEPAEAMPLEPPPVRDTEGIHDFIGESDKMIAQVMASRAPTDPGTDAEPEAEAEAETEVESAILADDEAEIEIELDLDRKTEPELERIPEQQLARGAVKKTRGLRWTPPYGGQYAADHADIVSGEIVPGPRVRR